MPAAFIVVVACALPVLQLYKLLAPELADIIIVVLVQLSVSAVARLTAGACVFCATVTLADALHPVAVSVAVTLYCAGVLTDRLVPVVPSFQTKPVAVGDTADSVTVVCAQVMVAGGDMVICSGVAFELT